MELVLIFILHFTKIISYSELTKLPTKLKANNFKAMNHYIKTLSLIFVSALFYINAYADNSIYELPTVGTTAAPPFSYTQSAQLGNQITISDTQISRSGANDIGQLINNIAGTQYIAGFGAEPEILIHSEPAMVLINGQPLTNFSSAAPDINLIPLSEIKQIIITPGVAGTTYGNQSLGGVINIITKAPSTKDQSLSASIGDPWMTQFIGVAAGPITEDTAYRANLQNEMDQGYRQFNQQNITRGGLTLAKNYATGSITIDTDIFRQTLEYPGYLSDIQVAENPRQSFYNQGQGTYQADTGYANIAWNQNLNSNWHTLTNINYRGQNASSNFFSSTDILSQNYNTEILNPELDGQWQAFNRNISTNLGIMISNEAYDQSNTNAAWLGSNIANANQQQYSTYGSLNIPLTTSLTLAGSARYVAVETAGNFFNRATNQFNSTTSSQSQNITLATIGLTDQLTQKLGIYARRAMGYQLPFIDQSNYTSNLATGFGLQATTSTSYETGMNYSNKQLQFDLEGFITNLDNEIGYYTPANGGPPANYNLSPTRREGVTFDSTTEPSSQWTLGDSITIMDNVFRSGPYAGNVIPGASDLLADLNARYQFNPIWSLYGEIQYTGPQYAEGDNNNQSSEIPGYYVANLAINAEFSSWLLSLRVDDLTNTTYNLATIYGIYDVPHNNDVSYYPAPGRTAMLSLTYRFK